MADAFESLDEVTKRLQKLADMYKFLGFTGFVVVVGVFIIIATISVAFQTVPGDHSSTVLNVDRFEEFLFLGTGMLLVVLGWSFLTLRTRLLLEKERIEAQILLAKVNASQQITDAAVTAARAAVKQLTEATAGGAPSELPNG